MAQAFPKSTFVGYDFHPGSIAAATAHVIAHGVSNVRFEAGRAQDFPGSYDFVTCFDCLHDMGDPAAAAAHVRRTLKLGDTWMVVEPNAGDCVEDNLNPVGRPYYSASTMICVPTSLAQETGAALGAQAGEARIAEVIRSGGFTTVRRASETPLSMVLEASDLSKNEASGDDIGRSNACSSPLHDWDLPSTHRRGPAQFSAAC